MVLVNGNEALTNTIKLKNLLGNTASYMWKLLLTSCVDSFFIKYLGYLISTLASLTHVSVIALFCLLTKYALIVTGLALICL